jgi:solute carrier family 25 carnitine/acylcarnitine transporter 20/29
MATEDSVSPQQVVRPPETFWQRFFRDLIAGTAGGVAQTFSGHPLDTMKIRLQTMPQPAPGQPPMYTGAIDCTIKTIKGEGPLALYKGVGSPLAGLTFLNAVLFVTYGYWKHVVKTYVPIGSERSRNDPRDPQKMSIAQYFLTGALVGVIVALFDCPVDLFKTQLQIQGQVGQKPSPDRVQYRNVVDCAFKITKTYGIRGPFQGIVPTLARDIPANSAYFGIYELTRRWLTPKNSTVDKLPPWKLLLAGGLGGVAFWISIYPIDVIKSSIQADNPDPHKRKYKGFVDCATQIYRLKGLPGFFKGFAPCLVRAFVANATCFLAYEYTRQFIIRKKLV